MVHSRIIRNNTGTSFSYWISNIALELPRSCITDSACLSSSSRFIVLWKEKKSQQRRSIQLPVCYIWWISSKIKHSIPSFYPVVVLLCCPENLTGWSQGLCPAGVAWLCLDQRQLHRTTSGGCRMGRKKGCRQQGKNQGETQVPHKTSSFKNSNVQSFYHVFPNSISQVGMFPVMMTSGSWSWRFALAVSLLLMNSLVGIISLHTAFCKTKHLCQLRKWISNSKA